MKKESAGWPERIICLTAETTEILYALGAEDRIVGVSGYTVRPPEARLKEKVAAFTSVRMDKIHSLKPDLIFAFSDLQKDIVRDLTETGYNVYVTNQRSLEEVGETILGVGRLIGFEKKAGELRGKFFGELNELAKKASSLRSNVPNEAEAIPPPEGGGIASGSRSCGSPRNDACRLRVYFEEWDDPLISGIRWVGELIRLLGGEDIFEELEEGKTARERRVDSEEVVRRNPEVILASWCGKKVQVEKIRSRPGWDQIEAVKRNQIYEIKSADILQPGLSLLHGVRQIYEIFDRIHSKFSLPIPARIT